MVSPNAAVVAGALVLTTAGAFVLGRATAPSARPAPPPGAAVPAARDRAPTAAPVSPGSGSLASPLGRAEAATQDPDRWRFLGVVELDDVTVRLHEHPATAGNGTVEVWSSGWQPPAGCRPTRSVTVQVSNPSWVASLQLTRDGAARFGGRSGVALLAGIDEGDPRWVVAVVLPAGTAPTGVDGVVVEMPGGVVVRAAVRDGVAVAVAPAPVGADDRRLDESVSVRAAGNAGPAVPIGQWREAAGPSGCSPPVVLMPRRDPAATDTVTAASGAPPASMVRDLVGTVLGGRRGLAALAASIDDPGPTGEFAAVEQQIARAGRLGGMVLAPEDWVVVASERIVVRYHVFAREMGATWWDRFAVLVRRDGTWRLTRDSVCEFVLLASAGCPGWRLDQGPTALAVAGGLSPG